MRRLVTKRLASGIAGPSQRRDLLVALSLLGFASGPAACISDLSIPDCVKANNCVEPAVEAGSAGQGADAGDGASGNGAMGGSTAGGASGGGASGGGASGGGASGGGASGGGVSGGEIGSGGGAGEINGVITPIPPLIDPCGTKLYSIKLNVSGGVTPFQWSLNATTGKWNIVADDSNSRNATLTGTPDGDVDVTVTATDILGRPITQVYPLAPRSDCYFAYVSPNDNGVATLSLRDPLFNVQAPIELAHNQGVYDFQFSPSGHFLVYRYQDTAATPVKSHLSLVDMSNWEEHALIFGEESITTYAWSPNSQFLAVMFEASGTARLGGVQVTLPTPPNGTAQLTTLGAVDSIASAEAGLSWLGNSFVAFYATMIPGKTDPFAFITPFTAQLGSHGFSAPEANQGDNYLAPVLLQPTANGFFMITGTAPGTGFHGVGSDGYPAEHDDDFVAPSGNLTASLDGDTLQFFNAADEDDLKGSIASANDCGKILTWAPRKDRIACVQDTSDQDSGSTGGEIRILDLVSANNTHSVTSSTILGSCTESASGRAAANACPDPNYYYDAARSALEPRLLSPSGRWLAFMTNTQGGLPELAYLSWADLNAQPIGITYKDTVFTAGAGQPPAANVLSFSPDERYLLLQTGSVLSLRQLSPPKGLQSVAMNLVVPLASKSCPEDFGAAPLDWCGSANRAGSFTWAPDSRRFAYRTANQIIVIDQPSIDYSDPHPYPMTPCSSGQCSGQFAFQPQP